MSVSKRTPLEGELDCTRQDYDVPDVLLSVCETGGTGLLTFSTTEAEKTLFVREGSYIFAKSSSMDDRLGEYLLRTQRVSLRDLASLSRMVKPGKRLGALLVESGALDPKELVQSVVGQVRSIVLSLFRWTKAEYRFVEQELPSKETITLNMPTAKLILDGIHGIDSWWRIERGIGELDSLYRAVPGKEEAFRSVQLDTPALELLAMLSKPKRIGDACTDSSLTEVEVCRLLWAFRSLGWVESVVDDGTALLDNWGVEAQGPTEETSSEPAAAAPEVIADIPAPAPPSPVADDVPVPAVVQAIVDPSQPAATPHFESGADLPFVQDAEQPFPAAEAAEEPDGDQTVLLAPAAASEPDAVPDNAESVQRKPEGEAEPPALDPSMDMDMEGLSEALKGNSSR